MVEANSSFVPRHPCFDQGAKATHGRVHLAVAPRCNIQCRYCNRNEDCVNESRPGVTSRVLNPQEALDHLLRVLELEPSIAVVGIAGPGDPLANPEATFRTLQLVRAYAPQMLLCLSTNGLALTPSHVATLDELGVSHVTITINAIDPAVGEKIYERVRDDRVLRGRQGAEHLLSKQLEGLSALKSRGMKVKINSVVIPGVNDHHIETIARTVSALGADFHNCIPLYPVKGTPFGECPEVSPERLREVQAQSARFMPQMAHCARCRADAIGLLGQDRALEFAVAPSPASTPGWPGSRRPYIAVSTREGILVNQHLGAATTVQIWEEAPDSFRCVEERLCPEAGSPDRWERLGEQLEDCRAILVSAAGEPPRAILEKHGVLALEMEGDIEECLEKVFRGHLTVKQINQRRHAGKSCECGQTRTVTPEYSCV